MWLLRLFESMAKHSPFGLSSPEPICPFDTLSAGCDKLRANAVLNHDASNGV